ncbi:MAG: sulfite exporter TauE/SafE family protein [Nitrospirota bacterium]
MEFNLSILIAISLLMFFSAFLYSSVGHGGGSGYLAVMALFGFLPELMKPTALSLNILVASIATIKYYKANYFSWQLFWPFAVTSIPFAFIGGLIKLSDDIYRPIVGFVLLFAAYRLFKKSIEMQSPNHINPTTSVALLLGAGIGLLSGITGVGGGIFLSPLLLFLGWAEIRHISGIAAAFILVNSISGLAGHWVGVKSLPETILIFGISVVIGGIIGSELGSRQLGTPILRRLLAVVLIIAGAKFIFV